MLGGSVISHSAVFRIDDVLGITVITANTDINWPCLGDPDLVVWPVNRHLDSCSLFLGLWTIIYP